MSLRSNNDIVTIGVSPTRDAGLDAEEIHATNGAVDGVYLRGNGELEEWKPSFLLHYECQLWKVVRQEGDDNSIQSLGKTALCLST